jgi:hypothetical protein
MLLTGGAVKGAISVITTPASGPTYTLTPVGGKTRVTLNTAVTSQPTTFLVYGDSTDQIENVVINSNVSFQTTFVEIRGTTVGTPIASVDSIDQGASTSTCILLDCRTTAHVGTIRVNSIADMNIGGDVTESITLPQRTSAGESSMSHGTVAGRIRGDVIADYGTIHALNALGGLGAPGAPVQVRTNSHLYRLVAKDIYADINTLARGAEGWTVRLETTNGPFVGSLTTAGVNWNGPVEPCMISINGDLDADVSMLYDIRNNNGGLPIVTIAGRFMPGRTFRIGRSLEPGAQFRVATPGGLKSRVIVNARNTGGVWSGPVMVGGSSLAPVPTYSPVSATLGGGAVGQAPFNLHHADCAPPSGSAIPAAAAPDPASPILLRLYGPVTWSGGGSPLLIEAAPLSSPGAWTDQTACFTIAREPGATPNPNIVGVYPARTLPAGYSFRIRPVLTGPSALKCDLLVASPPPVADFATPYTFTITAGCTGDADGNGTVTFADISAVLGNWGTGPAVGGCLTTSDVNADGTVNFGDITLVLSSFGNVCP